MSGGLEAILVPGCCTIENILSIECLYFDAFLSCCDEVGLKIKGLLINTSDDALASVAVVDCTADVMVVSTMVDGHTVWVLYQCLGM